MTIGSTTSRIIYTCDGFTSIFPVPIQEYNASDLTVILTSATGVQTVLILNSNYTLTATGTFQPTQWTLTTTVVYAAGNKLTIFNNPVETQTTQYVQGQAFPSLAVQTNMDRLTLMVQRQNDLNTRSIAAPDGDISPLMQLPPAASRANTGLVFDNNGNVSTGIIPTTALTQTLFNSLLSTSTLYPAQPGETGVVNFTYPPGTVDRYGVNTVPGTTDMFGAITAANTYAASVGGSVIFLPGEVYGVNCSAHGAGLTISANWVCYGAMATIIRIDFTATTQYYTAIAMGVSSLTMRGLIFNGQVTTTGSLLPNQDLGAVGSYGDNGTESLWSQVLGVIFRSTQECVVEDCHFRNFLRAGLRFDTGNSGGAVGPPVSPPIPPYASNAPGTLSRANIIHNCKTFRNRGVFGDGFLAVDTESTRWSNCYAYDYQRIGFCTDFTTVGEMGMQYVNCVAEYGHDAVTGASQGNAGFWIEAGDGVSLTNCESKSTSIGFELASSAGAASGVWRPYTATISAVGCKAVRCQSSGYKINVANRDTHVALVGCFAEVNSNAATYSGSIGIGSNAYQVSFIPTAGGPNGTSNVSCHVEMRGCRADMVAMSGIATASAFNCFNGAVTNGRQLAIVIDGLSTKWLTAAGADDTAALAKYESTTAPNFGYFGDIVFSGANNGGTRFGGFAKIVNCTNETSGNVWFSSECGSGNAVIEIIGTRVSLRTGGATGNLGILNLTACDAVDYRGNVGFSIVNVNGCFISDTDPGNKDRSLWGSNGTTSFQFVNCIISRNVNLSSAQGASSSHYLPTATFTGCKWTMTYQTEPGLTITKPGGVYSSLIMSGCTFIDTGSTSTTNPFIKVVSTDTNFVVMGAGNTFDSNLVGVAGGHVLTVNATSFDSPQTISGAYETVFGIASIPLS